MRNKVIAKIKAHAMEDDKYAPEVLGMRVRPTFFYSVAAYCVTLISAIVGRYIAG